MAEYSRDCLKTLRNETGIQYEGRQGGTLQLFRSEKQFTNAQRDIAVLRAEGVPYALLEANQLANAEPALAGVAHKLSGGLRLPNDETGDCHLFTRLLAAMAAKKGVEFRYNCSIDALVRKGDRIDGVSCGSDITTSSRNVSHHALLSQRHSSGCVNCQ
ncbi:hypothetical protein CE195_00370 [Sodalis-like symbiont of Philaenus spumarius]|nr:hypothetical protein CE195_00370 [Sodalis-like symbiont of Philaenus spumarius]